MKKKNLKNLKELYIFSLNNDNNTIRQVTRLLDIKIIINLEKMINEETPDDNISEQTQSFPIKLNIFSLVHKIKTSDIAPVNKDEIIEDNLKDAFKNCRLITHPRERHIQFMVLHNRFYTNERLFKHKIIDSPKCNNCDEIEDNDLMISGCAKAYEISRPPGVLGGPRGLKRTGTKKRCHRLCLNSIRALIKLFQRNHHKELLKQIVLN